MTPSPIRRTLRLCTGEDLAAANASPMARGGDRPPWLPADAILAALESIPLPSDVGTSALYAYATHPDERVPIALVAHFGAQLPAEVFDAVASSAMERALAAGEVWTPVLAAYASMAETVDGLRWTQRTPEAVRWGAAFAEWLAAGGEPEAVRALFEEAPRAVRGIIALRAATIDGGLAERCLAVDPDALAPMLFCNASLTPSAAGVVANWLVCITARTPHVSAPPRYAAPDAHLVSAWTFVERYGAAFPSCMREIADWALPRVDRSGTVAALAVALPCLRADELVAIAVRLHRTQHATRWTLLARVIAHPTATEEVFAAVLDAPGVELLTAFRAMYAVPLSPMAAEALARRLLRLTTPARWDALESLVASASCPEAVWLLVLEARRVPKAVVVAIAKHPVATACRAVRELLRRNADEQVLRALLLTATPEDARLVFDRLAAGAPAEAVRLVAGRQVPHAEHIGPGALAPLLAHADADIRHLALRALAFVGLEEPPSASGQAPMGRPSGMMS